jgi:hypothetical protein
LTRLEVVTDTLEKIDDPYQRDKKTTYYLVAKLYENGELDVEVEKWVSLVYKDDEPIYDEDVFLKAEIEKVTTETFLYEIRHTLRDLSKEHKWIKTLFPLVGI